MLRYTDLLTTGPSNIDEADLETLHRYFDDTQIVALNLVIAFANLTNRISEGLLASRR